MPDIAFKNCLMSLRRFWRLDITASDNALEKSIEENDQRENVCARALIFGLFIEVAFAFWFRDGKTFVKTWSPVFADILVAGGVLGEVHFASKISLASAELRRRSHDRLAEAIKLAGEANERTELLKKKNLEVEAALLPRRLSSEEQVLITNALKRFSGIVCSVVCLQEYEARELAENVRWCLVRANWNVMGRESPELPIMRSGVVVSFKLSDTFDKAVALSEAARTIVESLNACGIKASQGPPIASRVPEDLTVVVGTKPLPDGIVAKASGSRVFLHNASRPRIKDNQNGHRTDFG